MLGDGVAPSGETSWRHSGDYKRLKGGAVVRKVLCLAVMMIAIAFGSATIFAADGLVSTWPGAAGVCCTPAGSGTVAIDAYGFYGESELGGSATGNWYAVAALVILMLAAMASGSGPADLMAWWPLDGDLVDRVGGVKLTPEERPEFAESAMVFNGKTQYASAGKEDCLDIGLSDFTLEATF